MPCGAVELDLSETTFQKGFFTESCVILVEGTYKPFDRILKAQAVGHPPVERGQESRW